MNETANFKLALAIFVVTCLALASTLQFPMSGSYAGVENQWYVSPALFPLVLLTALMLLSFSLLVKSYLNGGASELFQVSGIFKDVQDTTKNRWLLILLLAVYIYVFVPNVDFFIGSGFICTVLMVRFYLKHLQLTRVGIVIVSLCTVFILVNSALGSEEYRIISLYALGDADKILRNDICLGMGLVSFQGICLFVLKRELKSGSELRKKYLPLFVTTIVVPFSIVLVFHLGLQVPMPVEFGSSVQFLDYIVYDFLRAS